VWGNGVVEIEQGVSAPGATINGNGRQRHDQHQADGGRPAFATNRDDIVNGNDGDDSINGARRRRDGRRRRRRHLLVDDLGDVVTEAANEGTADTVRSAIGYDLGRTSRT